MSHDERFMRIALDVCRAGVEQGQSPFGAALVQDGRVIAACHNHVWLATDPTAHAEVCAIRKASNQCGAIHFPGATMYSTTEPCPMCFCAIHWARIKRIVYAARVEDAKRFGFNELEISNQALKQMSRSPVELVADFLRGEAVELFEFWQKQGGKAY